MRRDEPLRGEEVEDADQTERLNQFLDGVVQGRLTGRSGLNPGLAAAARHVHTVAEKSDAPDLHLKRLVWEDIMIASAGPLRLPLSDGLVATTPSPGLAARSATTPKQSVLEVPTPRWRGFVGGFATAALVLLVVASAFGVREFAPHFGSDDPTSLPAIAAASPSAEIADNAAQPLVADCSVKPRTLDEMQVLLGTDVNDNLPAVPTPFVADPNDAGNGRGLPDGPVPDAETVAAVIAAYGEYFGCLFADDPLRMSAMLSDAMVVRSYYQDNGVPIIGQLMLISRTPDPERFRNAPQVGEPAPSTLSDFRMIGTDRVGAYHSSSSDGTLSGYIVFVRIDGRWLIDDFVAFRG